EEILMEKPSLTDLKDELYGLFETWTDILLTNLNDSDVQKSIGLLEDKQKQLVTQFIESKTFTLPISSDFIKVINTEIKRIHQETINMEKITSVFGDGNPITVKEIQTNLDTLLSELVGNNDENRIRITMKK